MPGEASGERCGTKDLQGGINTLDYRQNVVLRWEGTSCLIVGVVAIDIFDRGKKKRREHVALCQKGRGLTGVTKNGQSCLSRLFGFVGPVDNYRDCVML